MRIEHCHRIIVLYRLRDRARRLIAANRDAGNKAVAEIYMRIDDWLERQMSQVVANGRQ